jgi:hypothetical protein
MIHRTFGRLTVVMLLAIEVNYLGKRSRVWLCRCVCGNLTSVQSRYLNSGNTKSCGCLDLDRKKKIVHGESNSRMTLEYRAWISMKGRCYNKNHHKYPDYGGRGIRVCARWRTSYENFLEDMGRKPSRNHSLDRFPNNDGNYEPSNCRWATPKQQRANQRPRRKK